MNRVCLRAGCLAAVACLAAGSAALAADPGAVHYCADDSELFWFVQLSDTHTGNGSGSSRLQAWAATYEALIDPVLTVISGDLADNQLVFDGPEGERFWCMSDGDDWDEYKTAVADVWGPEELLDGPGNHDSDWDPDMSYFREHSVQGLAHDRTQNSVVKSFPFGAYHFLMTDTSVADSDCAFGTSGLDAGELAFIDSELATYSGCNLQLAFGHHPIDGFGHGTSAFRAHLQTYHVSLYGYGHTHVYGMGWEGSAYLEVNCSSLGKENTSNVILYAVDGDGLSARAHNAFSLPFVLVTAPVDRRLGGVADNPYDYPVPRQAGCPVRAIAFDSVVPALHFEVDGDGWWRPMGLTREHVYQGSWDTSGVAAGEHSLRVRAAGSTTAYHQITVYVDAAAPTWTPTPTATSTPTATATPTATSTPTASPTLTPSATPTPTLPPTLTPTAEPSATPTAEPSATPTAEPSATPTAEPSATPTAEPTATPLSPIPAAGPAGLAALLAALSFGLAGRRKRR